ncbi:MAG: endonuclease III [Muribaculaceae bacterium]|nr:endonuclease III [Muribaculaceae bacterium]
MKVAERYAKVLGEFEREMPVVDTELNFANPYQLLVAVILSAQCTDKRVNEYTPEFFRAFPTPQALAEAEVPEVYEYIKSISYPNNKAKALVGMARKLVQDFDGEVPEDMDSLISLPGVGRKTANVIRAVVFGRAAMAVDTHVFRVSERLGLTTGSKNPLTTEKALMKHIPEALVPKAHHWLILHGRYVCKARKPECDKCFLAPYCRKHERDIAARKRAALKAAAASTSEKE